MRLNPYLNFDGQCEAAFKFYAEALGGQIVAMMPFGDTPACEHMPPAERHKIMHARLVVGDQVLMGSDCTSMHPYEGVKGASVALNVEKPADAERIFAALSSSGQVEMPIQETFWAQRFGMVKDQYGVPWLVNCEKAQS
jgi:PhnB protein